MVVDPSNVGESDDVSGWCFIGDFGSGVGECNGDAERALAIGGKIWFGMGDFGNGDVEWGPWNACDVVALSCMCGWSLGGVCREDDILAEEQVPAKQQS